MEEQGFYNVYSYGDKLKPGDKLCIEHSVYFQPEKADLTDLTALPLAELLTRKETSVQQEEIIFKKLCAATQEWERQAADTLRIAKALEYVRTPTVEHTSNIWKKREYDFYEISNMVYKMSYRIYENTAYDHHLKKSVPASWEVSWWVSFNTPRTPDYTSQSAQISGQDRKRYTDKEAMEKYLQGRKDAFAHLFTELSPPIPSDQQRRFCINGQLLPGYTVEQERAAVVDELLEFLGDDASIIAELPPEKPVALPKSPNKHKAHKPHGRAAPSR